MGHKILGSRERKFDFLVQPSWEHVIKETLTGLTRLSLGL